MKSEAYQDGYNNGYRDYPHYDWDVEHLEEDESSEEYSNGYANGFNDAELDEIHHMRQVKCYNDCAG